jgi:hypothetical protein
VIQGLSERHQPSLSSRPVDHEAEGKVSEVDKEPSTEECGRKAIGKADERTQHRHRVSLKELSQQLQVLPSLFHALDHQSQPGNRYDKAANCPQPGHKDQLIHFGKRQHEALVDV